MWEIVSNFAAFLENLTFNQNVLNPLLAINIQMLILRP